MKRLLPVAILLLATPALSAAPSGQARVIDGDTLKIGATSIRLHGIDAPEKAQDCYLGSLRYRCGMDAKDALTAHIAGRSVSCEATDHDRYGRTVARCYVGGEDINAWMVSHGWAVAYSRYSKDYVGLEQAAHDAGVGVWRGEFQRPDVWRRDRR